MIQVQYPAPSFKIKKEKDEHYVFDAVRKTWILLTEEEWVRQNFIRYMTEVLHYPLAMIAVEKEIELNGLKKRFDILVYDKDHQPWMLIECKAPHIHLNDAVLEQLLRYHMSVPVPFLVVTNGAQTFGWEKKHQTLHSLSAFQEWK